MYARITSRRLQPLRGRYRLLAMQYPSATEATPQPPDLPTGQKASQPFRCGTCAGTTRKHANGPRLPCRDTAQVRTWFAPRPNPASTQAPLPDFSVSNTCPTRAGTGTKPAAEVLPALVMSFTSWITWLDGVTRRASGRMCGLPPAIVSASWRDRQYLAISGVRTQKLPLTLRPPLFAAPWAKSGSQTAFSASSSTTLTGKPLRAFHG